jgi:hypothetical protein
MPIVAGGGGEFGDGSEFEVVGVRRLEAGALGAVAFGATVFHPGVFDVSGALVPREVATAGERGTGSGREAWAGAKRVRKARSAAVIRVSRGLSNCMHSL